MKLLSHILLELPLSVIVIGKTAPFEDSSRLHRVFAFTIS
jgi:hypothetical protein